MNRTLLFRKDMTPIKKLLYMKAAAGGTPLSEYTATGNPLSFNTNIVKPLKSLVLPWTPTQSGTGDPSPENVRPISGVSALNVWQSGKNLFGFLEYGYYSPSQGQFMRQAVNFQNVTSLPIHVMKGMVVTVSQNIQSGWDYSYEEWKVKITDTSQMIPSNLITRASNATGATHTYTVQNDCWLTVRIATSGVEYEDAKLMCNFGAEALPFVPYVPGQTYPITFPALGRNLFDEVYPDLDGTVRYRSIYVGDVTVTLSSSGTLTNGALIFLLTGQATSGASTNTNGVGRSTSRTVTATDGYITIAYCTRSSGSRTPLDDDVMLNVGTTALPYEPYTNTVYGGSLDMTTGVLTVEWKQVIASTVTYSTKSEQAGYVQIRIAPDDVGYNSDNRFIMSDMFSINAASGTLGRISWYNDRLFANVPIDQVTSYDDAGVSDWYETYKPQIICKLVTPQTIQLTPTEVASLLGDNVIWSDTNESNTAIYLKKG